MISVAGIDKQTQDRSESLFGVNEKWCSSLRKLLRVSVYVLRFNKLRVWNRVSSEKQRNLKDKLLLSFIQHRRYRDVYVVIQNKKRLQLGVNADELEILRCYGRYLYADIPEDVKYPKLLPRHEHFTELVIDTSVWCMQVFYIP